MRIRKALWQIFAVVFVTIGAIVGWSYGFQSLPAGILSKHIELLYVWLAGFLALTAGSLIPIYLILHKTREGTPT